MEHTYLKEKYKPEIDGLRAFAVIAVILNHTSYKILPNGFLGVDIFFVISGFVLTLSLEAKKDKNLIEFLKNFFYRRIKRLMPALIIFCLIISLLATLFIPSPKSANITGITGLLGFSNLYLLNSSTDYFATDVILNPFTHTWSLDVEEQFYFIFPFLIWFSGFGRQKYFGKKNLLTIMLFLSSMSIFIYIYLSINSPISSYYLMPSRFWEMGAGSILFLIYKNKNSFFSKISLIPSSFILILISVIMLLPKNNLPIYTILVVLLTMILILSFRKDTFIFNIFNSKLFNHLGLLSYSLYLWHWAILSLSAWTIGIHWWTIPFQFIIIYIFSFLSYKYVEKPFRSYNFSEIKWKFFASFFSILIGSVGFIAFLTINIKNYIFLGDKTLQDNYSEKALWNYDSCSISSRGDKLPNSLIFDNCWFKNSTAEKNGIKKRQIFFYGSSYNQHLMSIPSEILKNTRKFKFNSFAATGCVSSLSLDYSKGNNQYCNSVFRKYLKFFIQSSNKGDQLVIANSYNVFRDDEELLNKYIRELEDLNANFEKNNLKLIVVSPIPIIKSNPSICSNWFSKYNNECDINNISDRSENTSLKKINKKLIGLKNKNILFIDLFSELENILMNKDKKIYSLFYNKTHLSKKGAKMFAKKFETIFNTNYF